MFSQIFIKNTKNIDSSYVPVSYDLGYFSDLYAKKKPISIDLGNETLIINKIIITGLISDLESSLYQNLLFIKSNNHVIDLSSAAQIIRVSKNVYQAIIEYPTVHKSHIMFYYYSNKNLFAQISKAHIEGVLISKK